MLGMILIPYTHFILQHNLVFTQNRSKVRSHYRHLENKFCMPYIPYQQDKHNQTQFGMYVSMENKAHRMCRCEGISVKIPKLSTSENFTSVKISVLGYERRLIQLLSHGKLCRIPNDMMQVCAC